MVELKKTREEVKKTREETKKTREVTKKTRGNEENGGEKAESRIKDLELLLHSPEKVSIPTGCVEINDRA